MASCARHKSRHRDRRQADALALTIDLPAKTVTVGSYGTVPIASDPNGDRLVYLAKPGSTFGLSSGTINRITGAASVSTTPPGGQLKSKLKFRAVRGAGLMVQRFS
jgi:hypothetical protein